MTIRACPARRFFAFWKAERMTLPQEMTRLAP